MALKWLEERWERLLPALELLGREQEEQIRQLCEAEKDWWRKPPRVKEPSSLAKPMRRVAHPDPGGAARAGR